MNGFFDSTLIDAKRKKTLPLVPSCNACKLDKGCKTPKMAIDGEGRKGIFVVGESPGKDEDAQGKPFVGMSGQMVKDAFAKCGIDFRKDCWIGNAASCRPANNQKTPRMVEYCRPLIVRNILERQPTVIVLLGGSAIESIIEWVWGETAGSVDRWYEWRIPCQQLNAWICPTWHPAFLKYEEHPVRNMFFQQHIEAAVEKAGKRPWKTVPDWKKDVDVILDDAKAAKRIEECFIDVPDEVAFDYETNMLKPDSQDARIVSCAMSDGTTTIAYPMMGKAIEATKKFLVSSTSKSAHNMPFEHRWSKCFFGVNVKSWKLCTMTSAHVLDNRPHITGLKFQAFVRLGMSIYNQNVESYFESKTSNTPNRIDQIPIRDLLVYNGLDALLEWKLGRKQMRDFNKNE